MTVAKPICWILVVIATPLDKVLVPTPTLTIPYGSVTPILTLVPVGIVTPDGVGFPTVRSTEVDPTLATLERVAFLNVPIPI